MDFLGLGTPTLKFDYLFAVAMGITCFKLVGLCLQGRPQTCPHSSNLAEGEVEPKLTCRTAWAAFVLEFLRFQANRCPESAAAGTWFGASET